MIHVPSNGSAYLKRKCKKKATILLEDRIHYEEEPAFRHLREYTVCLFVCWFIGLVVCLFVSLFVRLFVVGAERHWPEYAVWLVVGAEKPGICRNTP